MNKTFGFVRQLPCTAGSHNTEEIRELRLSLAAFLQSFLNRRSFVDQQT